jgi:hypothetical protein
MFLAHSFRLRDPWQREELGDGGVRWSRVFHRPTGLEVDDELWLVCSGLPPGAGVAMNTAPLTQPGHDAPYQFNVTALLADKNRIAIEIPSPGLPPAASSLPPSSAFPFDVRLGVVGHS